MMVYLMPSLAGIFGQMVRLDVPVTVDIGDSRNKIN